MPKVFQLKSNRAKIQPSRSLTSSLCFLFYVLGFELFFFFFFLPMPACRISVLQQELSQGHGSESPESQPLGHQETPRSFILNKTKISAICKLTKRNNQTSETVRCKKNSTGTRVLAVQARNTAASHTIPSSFSYRRTPLIHKKSIMHYYFYWSTIALQHCVGLCCRAE